MSDKKLLKALSAFNNWKRADALHTLAEAVAFPPERADMNMHVHSFFSYNGDGWSPSRIALVMKRMGLYGAALCDFDTLDGLDEFLAAGDFLGLRTAVSFESRVFFSEYADKEINSPGEPGVFYFMGSGFVSQPPRHSAEEKFLEGMLAQSERRNRELIARINASLPGCQLNYDLDVLPDTPLGNATERHIVWGYHNLAVKKYGLEGAPTYWASCFGDDPAKLRQMDSDKLNEYIRSKLMKKGGLGYVQPTRKTFPPLEEVIAMIRNCRALPVTAWLDGSLPGEANPAEQLRCLMEKGVEMVNIIPDRNWNFADPDKKAKKVQAMNEYLAEAAKLGLPVIAGTECNKPGQRLVDDFDSDALKPHMPQFLSGAQVLFGHTTLLRYADLSYIDDTAKAMFPDRNERNRFFASVGALPVPSPAIRLKLAEQSAAENLDYIRKAANNGKW